MSKAPCCARICRRGWQTQSVPVCKAGCRAVARNWESAVLALRYSGWQAWAGRRPFTLGSGPGNDLVLNGATLDGGGISARNGVRVPLLGAVFPELTVARMSRSGNVQHPWFHAARLTIAPSPALAIGLSRAAIFGGKNNIGVTPWRVLLMLMGRPDIRGKDSDFENQVAALDAGSGEPGWAVCRLLCMAKWARMTRATPSCECRA